MKAVHNVLILSVAFALMGCSAAAQNSADEIPDLTSESCPMDMTFDSVEALQPWAVINDGVMGGLSKGNMKARDGYATFDGVMNTDGGGFTSIRRGVQPQAYAVSDGVTLRVRPDDRSYKLTLRTMQSYRGRNISWQAELPDMPAGEWADVTVPFTSLKPSVFGRSVPSDPFDKTAVREIGIIIADGIDGPFSLDLASMGCMNTR